MTKRPMSRSAVILAQLVLLSCSLLFALAVRNQIRWILVPSAVILWIIVVIGYLNILIWMFKDGLIALARKAKARNVGWIPFLSGAITIGMLWKQGWVALSILYVLLLLFGLLLRVVASEKLRSSEVVR